MCVTPASVARVMLAATVLVPAHTTVAQTTQPKANERLVHALTFEIAVPSGADADTIVDDVIQVLRQRADPSGRHELQWRRVGHNRFEVRMPAAPAKVRQAERDYEQALDRLSGSINVDRLRALLALHVTRDERDRLPPAGVEARTQVIAEQLRWLKAEHPAVAAGIDEAARTHRLWQDQRTGLLDPRDLKQLVARNGVLEFRVAATKPKSSESGRAALTQARLAHYTERLEKHGPLGGERDDDFLWFPVRSAAVGLGPEIVTADYAGKTHVLLHNRNVHTMLQRVGADGKRPWSLTAFPASDQFGKPAVAFVLDARGAKQMALLSAAHKGNFLAILVDDEVHSAPIIRATVYEQGIIQGRYTQDEVDELVRILSGGVLPAMVNPEPVSEWTLAVPVAPRSVWRRYWYAWVMATMMLAVLVWVLLRQSRRARQSAPRQVAGP